MSTKKMLASENGFHVCLADGALTVILRRYRSLSVETVKRRASQALKSVTYKLGGLVVLDKSLETLDLVALNESLGPQSDESLRQCSTTLVVVSIESLEYCDGTPMLFAPAYDRLWPTVHVRFTLRRCSHP